MFAGDVNNFKSWCITRYDYLRSVRHITTGLRQNTKRTRLEGVKMTKGASVCKVFLPVA